jgi:hypothetical protein
MSTRARRLVLSTIVIFAGVGLMPAVAAAQVGDANLSVRVHDASGAVVPGATIEMAAQATGLLRTAVTGGEGTVTIAHLAPGRYRVSVSLSGFTTQVQEVTLLVGQTADLGYHLAPSAVAVTVQVSAAAPMIETNNATLHKVVTSEQVQALPINGRDFSTLATLVPGVTQGNTSENKNFDPVKRNLPAISINGQSGRNIDVLLDGGDNTDIQIGGQNIALSLEAVQEFEVITHDPKTQFNRGIGGVLNVVTKSGGNDVTGSGFGFFRNKTLQSIDAISAQLDKPKPPFSQQQVGGTIGGPMKKNEAFFFVSYERQRRNTSRVFNSGGAFAALDGTVTAQPFTQNFFLGKANGRVTASHNWMVRYAEQDNDSRNEFFSDSDAPGSTADETNRAHDLVASLTSILGTTRVNDLRVHYQWYENSIQNGVSSLDVPTLIFPAGTFGASQAGTQSPHQTTYEIRDDFSWTRGRHDIRLGGSWNYQPATGIKGDFRHNRFLFANNDYDPATNTIGPTNTVLNYRSWMSPRFYVDNLPLTQVGVYIQDDIRLERLTIAAGLRYDYVHNLFYNRGTLAESLVAQYHGQVPGGPVATVPHDPKNNLAPRVAITYDVSGKQTTVVRAGYARIWDPASILASTLYANLETTQVDGSAPFDFVFVPGSLLGLFGIVPGKLFDSSTLPFSFPIGWVNSPDMTTAHSDQINGGVEHQFTSGSMAGMALNVDVIYARTRGLTQGRNLNFCLNADCTRVNFPGAGEYPLVGLPRQIFLEDSTGRNDYMALMVSARRRMANRWEFFGNYTLASAKTDTNQFMFAVNDQLHPNAADEYGPSNFDERHRVVLSATVLLPGDIQLSTIFNGASARAYTPATNGDANGDGVPTVFGSVNNGPGGSRTWNVANGDRVGPRGSLRGDPTVTLDLRASKVIRVPRVNTRSQLELMFEVFNLTNATNYGNNYFDNVDDPARFKTPINIITPPRTAQLGVRFRF